MRSPDAKLEPSGASNTRPMDSWPIMSRSRPRGRPPVPSRHNLNIGPTDADGERLHEQAAHLEAWLRDVEKACGAGLSWCYSKCTHFTESLRWRVGLQSGEAGPRSETGPRNPAGRSEKGRHRPESSPSTLSSMVDPRSGAAIVGERTGNRRKHFAGVAYTVYRHTRQRARDSRFDGAG